MGTLLLDRMAVAKDGCMSYFARKLHELRLAAGMSKYRLAELAGLSWQGVALLEKGDREPSWDTVVRISLALGVSCEEFIDRGFTLPESTPPRPKGRPKGRRPGNK